MLLLLLLFLVLAVVAVDDSYKSISFCSIRGGGRVRGGVIFYKKEIATAKKRSTRHHRQLSGRFGDVLERALQCYGDVSATSTITTANITKTDIFANVTSNIIITTTTASSMCEWDCRFYEHGVVRRIAMYVMARRAATCVVQAVVVVQVSVAILIKV